MFFLPAGRIHAIGKGLLIAEIQQTSDITYRIYDFNRTDDAGNTRELHVDLAVDVLIIPHTMIIKHRIRYRNKTLQPNWLFVNILLPMF